MQQRLSEYDDRDDGLDLVGEDRAEEFSRSGRRLPTMLLTVLAMALFAGGLWFAYVQGTRHPSASAPGETVPLLRADEHPAKVRPDQPGGMAIPDQNISLYNERPGGTGMEKLLPAAEQPMPRPAPRPPEATAPPASPAQPATAAAPQAAFPPGPPAVVFPAAPVAGQPAAASTKPAAAKAAPPPAAKAAPEGKQPAPRAPATAAQSGMAAPVQLRLGALRSPEAAREEWARLKRENPDLLGKLTAVAVRTDLGDKGIYYRIQAGSFGDGAAAEKLCGELKQRKLGCILAR